MMMAGPMLVQREKALKPPGTPGQSALPRPVEAATPPDQMGTAPSFGASPGRGPIPKTPSSGGRIINTPEQLKPYLVESNHLAFQDQLPGCKHCAICVYID